MLQRTIHIIEEGMQAGLHVGAQLCVRMKGERVGEVAMGKARLAGDWEGGVDVAMTGETLMLWLSAGKPITAAAIMMLWERNLVGLDEPVAAYWPEFGVNGKDGITLRHILTHMAGIRGVDTAYPFATWEETVARIAEMKLERDWAPGLKAGYHTHTSWYVLGEVIQRVTGVRHDRWIREQLLLPLGMRDTWLAMEEAVYAGYGERIGYLYDTMDAREGMAVPMPLKNYDTVLGASRPRPSASCRGPMRELVRFYDMLRGGGELEGIRVLRPETVAAMTMRQRVGLFDQTFRQTIDWGLGIIVNSSQYGPAIPYQFGPYASPTTFGHGGSQSSTGFCDPRHGLVVSLVFNGCPGEAAHDKRLRAVLRTLYEELGIGE